jgi:Fungal specific transcription factor domain
LDLLPPQAACDEAVNSYFRSFEKSLRILHCPSFKDEYRRFWGSTEDQRGEFQSFVAQLVVVLAIVHDLEAASFSGVERDNRAAMLCSHVQAWSDSLAGRKQLTMATLRTRALLILAQQVRAAQADEVWKATGSLMRSAMMAGLHRDPSEFPDIPIFEGELRRRFWMTIVEMDLATALINGMPIMLHDGDFTSRPPSNLDDLDLFDGMTELPRSKPFDESTDSMFQVALAESLPLRLRAMCLSETQMENVQELIHALETHIRQLPSKLSPNDGGNEDLRRLLGTIMLNVHIRRVLSHLYRSSISWTDFATGQTTAGLQSSLSVLSYQKFFDPNASAPNPGDREKYWNLFHILGRNDIMQAALDVCLYVQAPGLVSWTKASLLLAIDDTISSLMRRISRNGSDIKDITRLSVIAQLLKSQFTQADSEDMMKEGTYNVLMACRRAVEQEDLWSGEADNGKV